MSAGCLSSANSFARVIVWALRLPLAFRAREDYSRIWQETDEGVSPFFSSLSPSLRSKWWSQVSFWNGCWISSWRRMICEMAIFVSHAAAILLWPDLSTSERVSWILLTFGAIKRKGKMKLERKKRNGLCVASCQDWCHPSLCRPDL